MHIPLQLRRGTTDEWTMVNPTLAEGEIAYDTTTKSVRAGTGSQQWTSLSPNALTGPRGNSGTTGALVGGVQWYLQSTPPIGCLPCDGSVVSAVEYPSLQLLPPPAGFSGGIGYFSFMQGGGTDYGYGPGQPFTNSDITSNIPKGSGALSAISSQDGIHFWRTEQYLSTWIWGYVFHRPVVINRYAVSAITGGSPWNFGKFTFEGSNNGSSYTVLDTQTTFASLQEAATPVDIINTTAYKYYRFNITEHGAGGSWMESIGAGKIALEGIPIAPDTSLLQLPLLSSRSSGNGTTLYPYIKY